MKIPYIIATAILIGVGGMLQQGFIILFDDYNPFLVSFIYWFFGGLLMLVLYKTSLKMDFLFPKEVGWYE